MDCDFTINDLNKCSYRFLQQTAKAMFLPSNVKKIYLVQMIYAKKYYTDKEVKRIVSVVKQERQQVSIDKKKKTVRTRMTSHIQGDEITSTSNLSVSLPITVTPKRPRHIVQKINPEVQQTVMMKNPKSILLENTTTPLQKSNATLKNVTSDRVLRSCNVQALKKSNLEIFSASNTMIKVQNPEAKVNETRIKIISKEESRRCILKSCNTTKTNTVVKFENSSLLKKCVPYPARTSNNKMVVSTQLAKKQQLLSGNYPLQKLDEPFGINVDRVQSIGIRNNDGKYSKIDAIVQKSNNVYSIEQLKMPTSSYDICIQDVKSVQTQTQTTIVNQMYPNMSAITDTPDFSYTYDSPLGNHKENFINEDEYYHKKIRADQMKCQRRLSVQKEMMSVVSEEKLPNIGNVFSKFNSVNYNDSDMSQSSYNYVCKESEGFPSQPVAESGAEAGSSQVTDALETLLNIRSQFLPQHQPLVPVNTTTATTCIHSTPVIVSACEQLPSLMCTELYPSQELDNQDRSNCNAAQSGYFLNYNDNLPGAVIQDVNVSIPDMFDDAFEIISQDRDYIERLSLDISMQCILCSWAGPRTIMEYHIRKDHSQSIHREAASGWSVEYSLGSLAGRRPPWACRVSECGAELYALSVRLREPARFMATLATFTYEPEKMLASLTILNKVTGEPHSWEGEIQKVPPNLPYDNDLSCLTVELSELNLLPATADASVTESHNKMAAGPPELNDSRITLNVKIY